MASSTSLASTTPLKRSGMPSSQRTWGKSRNASCWRARSSPDSSMMVYEFTRTPMPSRAARTSRASLPVPAPNSMMSGALWAIIAAAARATAAPNRGEISGAVVKSPLAPSLDAPPL